MACCRRRADARDARRRRRCCASTCPSCKVRVVNVVDLMRLQPRERAPARPVRRASSTRCSPTDKPGHLRLPRLPVADPPAHLPAHQPRATSTCAATRRRARPRRRSTWSMLNDLDRFHLVDRRHRPRARPRRRARPACASSMVDERLRHRAYTREHGDDLPDDPRLDVAVRRRRAGVTSAAELLRSGTFGPGPVELRETHGSWVFLTAAPRLQDQEAGGARRSSTTGRLSAGGAMCRLEVEVNRRAAPRIYLGVRAIVPGFAAASCSPTRTPVERSSTRSRCGASPRQQRSSARLARDDVGIDDVGNAVGKELAAFHARCGDDRRPPRAPSRSSASSTTTSPRCSPCCSADAAARAAAPRRGTRRFAAFLGSRWDLARCARRGRPGARRPRRPARRARRAGRSGSRSSTRSSSTRRCGRSTSASTSRSW